MFFPFKDECDFGIYGLCCFVFELNKIFVCLVFTLNEHDLGVSFVSATVCIEQHFNVFYIMSE